MVSPSWWINSWFLSFPSVLIIIRDDVGKDPHRKTSKQGTDSKIGKEEVGCKEGEDPGGDGRLTVHLDSACIATPSHPSYLLYVACPGT